MKVRVKIFEEAGKDLQLRLVNNGDCCVMVEALYNDKWFPLLRIGGGIDGKIGLMRETKIDCPVIECNAEGEIKMWTEE